jgi:Helix-turn-helix.
MLGYTQEYMANKLNISVNSYGELESGGTKIINLRIVKIAEILNESLEFILFGAGGESDYGEQLKLMEEEFLKKIESIHTQYQIKIKELEGVNEELKVALKTKEGIIGVLKEKLPNY